MEREDADRGPADDGEIAEVVRRAQRGDPEALVLLLERYHEPLERLLRSYTSRLRVEIEDLMQETRVAVMRYLPRFEYRGPDSLRAWILTLARNRANDLIDKVEKQPKGAHPESLSKEQTSVLCGRLTGRSTTTPSKAAERKELEALVPRAMSVLTPLEQWLVWSKLDEGKTEVELLVELLARFPESDVRTRGGLSSAAHRALVKLSDELHRLHLA